MYENWIYHLTLFSITFPFTMITNSKYSYFKLSFILLCSLKIVGLIWNSIHVSKDVSQYDVTVIHNEAQNHDKTNENDENQNAENDYTNIQYEKGNMHGTIRDFMRWLCKQIGKTFVAYNIEGTFGNLKILPGTKWCGEGNKAESKDDLGFFSKSDSCCRNHDLCPDIILKNETKYGLYNNGFFSRLHCECDQQLYKCLKQANDLASDYLKLLYFTILGPQCFQKNYRIIGCKTEMGISKRCIDYEFDYSREQIYQWFDNPEF